MKTKVYNGYSDEATAIAVIQNVINRMNGQYLDSINDKVHAEGESFLIFAGKGAQKLEHNHIQLMHKMKENFDVAKRPLG